MCLYPSIRTNKRYLPNKKNGYTWIKCDDERKKYVAYGCGKCIECMKQKRRNWQVRLQEEIRDDKTGNFVTLTFNEESIKELSEIIGSTESNTIATLAVRRFLERWRKKHKKSVKHWLITELGHKNTERLHLHGIIFTKETKDIEKIWKYGHIVLGNGKGTNYVNEKTINYIIKYVTKIDEDHKEYQPIILTSPGIGNRYTYREDAKRNKFNEEKTIETYKLKNGMEIAMPIYIRNKLWTEDERDKLWTNLLDKNTRYVCGEKIDVSTIEGEIEYEKTLSYYQQKNEKLGFGTNKWSKKDYVASKKLLKNLQGKK